MILYHYSVDSYKGAEHLTNDYKNNYRFAEPYVLALRKSREILDSVFFSTMYMSREVSALGLRKYDNYRKDLVEGIFEYIRETEFPEATSRLRCVYYCESEKEAVDYANDDCLASGLFRKDQVALLKVEVEDSRIYRYDQTFYNLSLQAVENNDVESVFEYARKYFSCKISNTPLIEIVSDGNNHVLQRIEY